MTEKAKIVFVLEDDNFYPVTAWGIYAAEMMGYLEENPPHVDDDSYALIRFFHSGCKIESSKLTNTLPGSNFTHYRFERHDFHYGDEAQPVTVIVGWYWTE